ncbi:MAG: HAD-IA family hydrolase [Candidatus Krumholzibacteriota bacterium]|nr:HAD-IA family hydrolase [Candidatus Krumholzibacteriota bacterium]
MCSSLPRHNAFYCYIRARQRNAFAAAFGEAVGAGQDAATGPQVVGVHLPVFVDRLCTGIHAQAKAGVRVAAQVVAGSPIGADGVIYHRQVEDGLALDIGAFVAGLEYATGKEAILVGKPNPLLFLSALSDLGVNPGDAIMVGDDINSDIGGAQAAGIRGVLVRTGKYRAELVAESGVEPDAVIDSVAQLCELI